ncbi:MAG: peptidylprolyl isomerase [Lautropia sp.]|nr:peptidylprolyl isomerase [Lautropia sp.]
MSRFSSHSLLSPLAAMLTGAVLMSAPADGAQAADKQPQVLMKTSLGDLVIELYPEKAPKTVENFLKYVDDSFYANTIFHRVIGNFMIQGGGFDPSMQQKKTRDPIPLESRNGLKNDVGYIAMARTMVPDSATAQFFINTVNNNSLNYPSPDGHGYAVFGKVIKGMDTVEKIAKVPTGRHGPHGDVPKEAVIIESVTRVQP